ncbi:unnamed protein product [Urochloa humidicola]
MWWSSSPAAVVDDMDVVFISIDMGSAFQSVFLGDAIVMGVLHTHQRGALIDYSSGNNGPNPKTVVNSLDRHRHCLLHRPLLPVHRRPRQQRHHQGNHTSAVAFVASHGLSGSCQGVAIN